MKYFNCVAKSSLSLPLNNFIYSLEPTSNAIAAISSDDSLRIFDPLSLSLSTGGVLKTGHGGVTRIKSFDRLGNILVTTGVNGSAFFWDIRVGTKVATFNAGRAPLVSLDCNAERNAIVVGTGDPDDRHQVSVMVWDVRTPEVAKLQYADSHNDDVTEASCLPNQGVQFHPHHPSLLLSGSSDGLLNVYDMTIAEEEDALYQVIPFGSSIHKAGFLDDANIFALSNDEIFSMYQLASPEEKMIEPPPMVFGDLREKLNCRYVIDVKLWSGDGALVAVGDNSDKRVDIFNLRSEPHWTFDPDAIIRIPEAHGDEIVRSVYVEEKSRVVYTAGEDGLIRAWANSDSAE